jgi:Mg-chelatase subunit ChlD
LRSKACNFNVLNQGRTQLRANKHSFPFSRAFAIKGTLRLSIVLLVLLFGCGGSRLLCQSVALPQAEAIHQEAQLSLDVDRDPIPSPDAEEVAPSTAASPLSPAKSGEVQKREDGIYTMHKDVDEVLQYCAVVDDKGRLAPELTRGNFRVWEDGVEQVISSFLHQEQPVSLGILIDNSGSMLDKRAAVNSAALNLIKALSPQDATFIVNFSDRAFLDQGFTSDLALLNRGLSHFGSSGTTALYEAVAASADELTNHGKLPKQVLLVITDGADNASRISLEQTIRRVQSLGGAWEGLWYIASAYSSGPTKRNPKELCHRLRGCLRRQVELLIFRIPCRTLRVSQPR